MLSEQRNQGWQKRVPGKVFSRLGLVGNRGIGLGGENSWLTDLIYFNTENLGPKLVASPESVEDLATVGPQFLWVTLSLYWVAVAPPRPNQATASCNWPLSLTLSCPALASDCVSSYAEPAPSVSSFLLFRELLIQ